MSNVNWEGLEGPDTEPAGTLTRVFKVAGCGCECPQIVCAEPLVTVTGLPGGPHVAERRDGWWVIDLPDFYPPDIFPAGLPFLGIGAKAEPPFRMGRFPERADGRLTRAVYGVIEVKP